MAHIRQAWSTISSRPVYVVFWFPLTTFCVIVAGFFVVMWVNAPSIPRYGMEALIAIPYLVASLAMSPFLIGLIGLIWLRPKRSAWKPSLAIPTVLLTWGLILAIYLQPRPGSEICDFRMKFADQNGKPISNLHLDITYSSPGFDLLRGNKKTRHEKVYVQSDEYLLKKTKGEDVRITIGKESFYFVDIEVRNSSAKNLKTGLQLVRLSWQKRLGHGKWGVDACSGAMNWPLISAQPFVVIMLDSSSPAVSPIKEYEESDMYELTKANK